MTGLVLVTVLHTFPFVYLLASTALLSVDASYEEAAQNPRREQAANSVDCHCSLVAPAILSGTLLAFVNAIALFGSQAIIGLPGRIVTLPTTGSMPCSTIRRNTGLLRRYHCCFVIITVIALYLQRAFLARRSYVTLAGKAPAATDDSRSGALAGVRIRRAHLHRRDYSALFHAHRGVVLEIWGLDFWKGLTLANYKFILFEYNVTSGPS